MHKLTGFSSTTPPSSSKPNGMVIPARIWDVGDPPGFCIVAGQVDIACWLMANATAVPQLVDVFAVPLGQRCVATNVTDREPVKGKESAEGIQH